MDPSSSSGGAGAGGHVAPKLDDEEVFEPATPPPPPPHGAAQYYLNGSFAPSTQSNVATNAEAAAAAATASAITTTTTSSSTATTNTSPQPTARQRVSSDAAQSHRVPFGPVHVSAGRLKRQLIAALKMGGSNFILAYNVRAGIGLLLRILKLLRTRPKSLLSLSGILSEPNLVFREDAVRLGLFIGGFSAIYRAARALLIYIRQHVDGWSSAIPGCLAGMTVMVLDRDRRRTLALYAATRMLQCAYNASKARGWWHMWGSDWPHGDTLLFAISSAQIMYAYVLRPNTLPPSYYRFIRETGPIPEFQLQQVRKQIRGLPIDLQGSVERIMKAGGSVPASLHAPGLPAVPCELLHPHNASHIMQVVETFVNGFKRVFPLYLSLTFVPAVVLKFPTFLANPLSVIGRALLSATRSTTFLSTFVGVYMGCICLYRLVFRMDHKLSYWFAGWFASLSLLIERKSRRSELALYALPRAADSLFMILRDRRWLGSMPHGEVALFASSMGALLYFYQHESTTMAPLLYKILRRFMNPSS